jgi:predicted metal-dependent hydrolase
MRARDALGRHVEPGSPDAVEPVSEDPLPPLEALAAARALLAVGRAFSAHEVFEASWKAAGPDERDLWQGLAQLCVGLTHLQRGNPVGAATLLRRGAGHLTGAQDAYGLDLDRLVQQAHALADEVDAGATEGWIEV